MSEIHEAVKADDVTGVSNLLAGDRTLVNAIDYEREATPLHFAAARASLEMVYLLLANGADVDAIDKLGRTPLHQAASRKSADIAWLLISSRADVNATDLAGRTPLHRAASGDHVEIVRLLIRSGADVNARSTGDKPTTPLDEAIT